MTEWDAAGYAHISALQKAMAEEVLALLQLVGSERVLDVGCGEGKITAQIAARTPRGSVLGIDPSRGMIQFARDHFGAGAPNLRFEVGEAQRLSFHEEFELAVSFNALHWVPEQEAALQAIRASLKPNGRAQLRLVAVGARQSLESVVEEVRSASEWRAYFEGFHDPYLRLTPEEYAALAERNGFRVLHLETRDHAWDFGSRTAFTAFCAVGLVAWTDRLPAAERPKFLNAVLDHYQRVAADETGGENTFKFYQMDILLMASDARDASAVTRC